MRHYRSVADRTEPRFRISKYRYKSINRELFEKFKETHSNIKMDYSTFRDIIMLTNLEFVNCVIEERDGVMLPRGMGRMYLGLYPGKMRKKEVDNETDKTLSILHNFETNDFEGKIMWMWDNIRYKTENLNFYCFVGHRDFKKRASNGFIETPERYLRENKFIRKEEYRKLRKHGRTQTDSEICDQPSENASEGSECGLETNE